MTSRTNATLLVGILAGTAAIAGTGAPAVASADAMSLADLTRIHVEGTRMLSMSPDGRWFVASSYEQDQLCVFEVPSARRVSCADLSELSAGLRLEDVAWSTDGTQIAFVERTFQFYEDGDLWLMDAATGTLTNLDDDGFVGRLPMGAGTQPADVVITLPSSPTFTPDGTGVTYSRTFMNDGRAAGDAIVTVPVAGGEPRQLVLVDPTEPGVAYHGMRWSPDGSRLYYSVAHNREHPDNGIWTVSADGSDPAQLVGSIGDATAPTYLQVLQVAPDGAHLLAWDPLSWNQFASRRPYLSLVDTATGAASPIVPLDPDAPPDAVVSWAGFSPDGGSLLTQRFVGDPSLDVWVRDIGGETETQLVQDHDVLAGWVEQGIPITWAPNGTAFLTGAGDLGSATLLTISGSALTQP